MTERSLRQKRRASGEPSSLPKVAKLDGALARKVRQVEASLSPSRWPAVAAPSPARRVSTRCLSHCPGLQRMEAQRLQEEALKAFGIVNRQGQRALRARAPPAPSPAPAPQHKGGKQQQPKQQPRRQPQPGGKARGGGSGRRLLQSITIDGREFRVGENVYVVLDASQLGRCHHPLGSSSALSALLYC